MVSELRRGGVSGEVVVVPDDSRRTGGGRMKTRIAGSLLCGLLALAVTGSVLGAQTYPKL